MHEKPHLVATWPQITKLCIEFQQMAAGCQNEGSPRVLAHIPCEATKVQPILDMHLALNLELHASNKFELSVRNQATGRLSAFPQTVASSNF